MPHRLEFWQEEPGRLHQRHLFQHQGQRWAVTMLQP
jgi:pyridoxine/pyridoxamine 5'-phosphate oxidase